MGGGLGPGGLSGSGGGLGSFFGGGTNSNKRFNLTLSVNARNVLNDVNLGCRVGYHRLEPVFWPVDDSAVAGTPGRESLFQVTFTF